MKIIKRIIVLIVIFVSVIDILLINVIADSSTNGNNLSVEELTPLESSSCPNSNDFHHYFDNPDHNLDGFLAYYNYNYTNAYYAVYNPAQAYVTANGICGIIDHRNQITIDVSGFWITVRGKVIDGVLRIGTLFIE